MNGALDPVIAKSRVVVTCGTGGVGKTSCAAALGLVAARRGRKVVVLTIDPAKRLADAIGLGDAVANEPVRVQCDAPGELWVAMLDVQATFDSLVVSTSSNEEQAQRVLSNPFYRGLSQSLSGTRDYMAAERLHSLANDGRFDLVIVDTPPTRNALDFLEAPHRMAEFFGGRLLRWLTAPYRLGGGRGARLVNLASRPFYQVADRILGSQFLEDIAEFFLNFQSMYDGFVERARAVERLLHDRRTSFVVVTTLEASPLAEAEVFCRELVERGFPFGALVLNKTLPAAFTDPAAGRVATTLLDEAATLAAELAAAGQPALADAAIDARVLRTVAESFRNFAVVAARESELRHELARLPDTVVDVPNLDRKSTRLNSSH